MTPEPYGFTSWENSQDAFMYVPYRYVLHFAEPDSDSVIRDNDARTVGGFAPSPPLTIKPPRVLTPSSWRCGVIKRIKFRGERELSVS